MNTGISNFIIKQGITEIITFLLGLSENDGLILSGHGSKNFFQSFIFLILFNDFNDLFNIGVNIVFHITNLDVDGSTLAEIESEFSHSLRPGGREHKSLSVRSDLANDFSNGRFETHIKHSIGFIKNKIGNSLQIDDLTF